jgi:hypothetical protein
MPSDADLVPPATHAVADGWESFAESPVERFAQST